jgi:type VI secretion system protein ImpH
MASHDRNTAGFLEHSADELAYDTLNDEEGRPTFADLSELSSGSPDSGSEQQMAALLAVAHRTGFFSMVSLLERMTRDAVRIGGDGPPADEAIRFRHDPSLTFAAGDISSARVKRVPIDPDNRYGPSRPVIELVTTFLGLTGSASPLPLYIAEEVNHEDEESGARRDFLDIFHHRLISILYRAVSRYSPVREHRSGGGDVWMDRALAISGMDPETFVTGCSIPPGKLLRLAPLVARRGRGVRALVKALNLVLGEQLGPDGLVEIEEFAGGWVRIHTGQRSALGVRNHDLGHAAMLGEKAYDKGGRFKVIVGPLDNRGRDAFSENGEGLLLLKDCVNLMVRESLDYDVELRISAGAARPFCLSTVKPSKLGLNTRLACRVEDEVITLRNMRRFSSKRDESASEA